MNRHDPFDDIKIPLMFKLWFAFVALIAAGLVGLAVWAIIALVGWVTSQ